MKKKPLASADVKELLNNPNVDRIVNNRIFYKEEFKHFFNEERKKGKGPTQIFREAGFDTKVLGPKRIERAAANWRDVGK